MGSTARHLEHNPFWTAQGRLEEHPHYNVMTTAAYGELEWILDGELGRHRNEAKQIIWDGQLIDTITITTNTTQTEIWHQTDLQDTSWISSTQNATTRPRHQSHFAQTPTDSDLNWTWTTFWNSSARDTASERHNNAVTSLSSKHWGVTEHSTFRYCWAGRSTLYWNTSPKTTTAIDCPTPTICNLATSIATARQPLQLGTSAAMHCNSAMCHLGVPWTQQPQQLGAGLNLLLQSPRCNHCATAILQSLCNFACWLVGFTPLAWDLCLCDSNS